MGSGRKGNRVNKEPEGKVAWGAVTAGLRAHSTRGGATSVRIAAACDVPKCPREPRVAPTKPGSHPELDFQLSEGI